MTPDSASARPVPDAEDPGPWPPLPWEAWRESCATLHMWTQIVGKVRKELTPWINHSWGAVLYVTPRGLTTSAVPHGDGGFEVRFDFVEPELVVRTHRQEERRFPLEPISVAVFHERFMGALGELGIEVEIDPRPNEVEDPIPFPEDTTHAAFDPEAVRRFGRVLLSTHRVFQSFRAEFVGKCSPSHFFWGSFDHAVTRFSGEEAPEHPGGIPNLPDAITREAYSHAVSSAGFWPGGEALPEPIYYSYAYPEPDGFPSAEIAPEAARYQEELGEFVLPYEAVRRSERPDETLLSFLRSTYTAAAELGDWDRERLERPEGWVRPDRP